MTTVRKSTQTRSYHSNAYQFVFAALRHAQEKLGRDRSDHNTGHVSARELVEGIRELAPQHFGLMTISVFADWGVHATEDFGKIVFELIEGGEMRKTENDHLEDGNILGARKAFTELITEGGETPYRGLAAVYLLQLSDDAVETISNSFVSTWEDFVFPGDEPKEAASDEKKDAA